MKLVVVLISLFLFTAQTSSAQDYGNVDGGSIEGENVSPVETTETPVGSDEGTSEGYYTEEDIYTDEGFDAEQGEDASEDAGEDEYTDEGNDTGEDEYTEQGDYTEEDVYADEGYSTEQVENTVEGEYGDEVEDDASEDITEAENPIEVEDNASEDITEAEDNTEEDSSESNGDTGESNQSSADNNVTSESEDIRVRRASPPEQESTRVRTTSPPEEESTRVRRASPPEEESVSARGVLPPTEEEISVRRALPPVEESEINVRRALPPVEEDEINVRLTSPAEEEIRVGLTSPVEEEDVPIELDPIARPPAAAQRRERVRRRSPEPVTFPVDFSTNEASIRTSVFQGDVETTAETMIISDAESISAGLRYEEELSPLVQRSSNRNSDPDVVAFKALATAAIDTGNASRFASAVVFSFLPSCTCGLFSQNQIDEVVDDLIDAFTVDFSNTTELRRIISANANRGLGRRRLQAVEKSPINSFVCSFCWPRKQCRKLHWC